MIRTEGAESQSEHINKTKNKTLTGKLKGSSTSQIAIFWEILLLSLNLNPATFAPSVFLI